MDTIAHLAESVASARSLEGLTRPLLEMLESVSGYESVYLTAIDGESELQHILYARNAGKLSIPENLGVPWHQTLCRRAIEEKRFVVDDVRSQWPESDAARQLGIRSYASVPVESGTGTLYGTLCAASSEMITLPTNAQSLLRMFAKLIGQHIERETLLENLNASNVQLQSVAMTDPLTGLANRRALLAELTRMLAVAQREGQKFRIAFIDLDGFKRINDAHGHDIGDAFLAAMAARLRSGLRVGDFLARYGGDEFVLLAHGEGAPGEDLLASRLAELTRFRFIEGNTVIDYAGASVGVIEAGADDKCESVLARADAAMYATKRSRNTPSPVFG